MTTHLFQLFTLGRGSRGGDDTSFRVEQES
jgi:hypothetical protein